MVLGPESSPHALRLFNAKLPESFEALNCYGFYFSALFKDHTYSQVMVGVCQAILSDWQERKHAPTHHGKEVGMGRGRNNGGLGGGARGGGGGGEF